MVGGASSQPASEWQRRANPAIERPHSADSAFAPAPRPPADAAAGLQFQPGQRYSRGPLALWAPPRPIGVPPGWPTHLLCVPR